VPAAVTLQENAHESPTTVDCLASVFVTFPPLGVQWEAARRHLSGTDAWKQLNTQFRAAGSVFQNKKSGLQIYKKMEARVG
jgi:hypothetical protein